MFDLNEEIAKWRRQMLAAGIITSAQVDELESHLRENFHSLTAATMDELEAFQLAVSRLGAPDALRAEFSKLECRTFLPVTIGSWLWLGAMLAVAFFLAERLFAEKSTLLLVTHIFAVTGGYSAALLAGAFGILYVCYRAVGALSPIRERSLARGALHFNRLAVGLTVMAFVLGMLWGRHYLGVWFGGSPREVGGLCACAWLVMLSLFSGFGSINQRVAMLMSVFGNIVIGLAWFGAGMVANHWGLKAYGAMNVWPLGVFLGVHVLALGLGMKPESGTAREL